MSGDCLSMDVDHGAAVSAEAEVGVRVADLADRSRAMSWMSTYVVVEISPETTTRPVFTKRLAGHAAHRVIPEDGVQDPVGDLVGDLVRMALGDALGT